jgi:hypothetical protein
MVVVADAATGATSQRRKARRWHAEELMINIAGTKHPNITACMDAVIRSGICKICVHASFFLPLLCVSI